MSYQTFKNSKNLNLLLVTHYYPEHRGGVEIVAGKLVEYLTQKPKINITWMASNVDKPPYNIAKLECLPMKASNFFEKTIAIPYPLWSIPSLFKLWQTIRSQDLVYLHDYLYMSNLVAFVFAKIQKKKIVITQHIGLIPYKNPLFRGLLSLLNSTIGTAILKNADRTVFISETVQKYFVSKANFPTTPLMIPNGVETKIFFPRKTDTASQVRQQLNLPQNRTILLFVGRFVEKKGLPILQQLAVHFSHIHWMFAGWGSLDPESWNLPNVSVFRNLRGAELRPIYQAADMLVLPSVGEGFPLVVQEAMACGTPVMVGEETANACVAAKHLMFSEAVEGTDTFRLWANKITEICHDTSILAELRFQVAEFAREYWSWDKCSTQYYDLFQRLNNSK